jgi:hypothetical protein
MYSRSLERHFNGQEEMRNVIGCLDRTLSHENSPTGPQGCSHTEMSGRLTLFVGGLTWEADTQRSISWRYHRL